MLTNNEIKINKTQHSSPTLYMLASITLVLLRAVSSTSIRGTEERTYSSERGGIIADGVSGRAPGGEY